MKGKFIKSSVILIVGGFITKLLGLLNKIFLTRLLDSNSLNLYMLILPTFMLFSSVASFGLSTATSILVASNDKNNKTLVFSNIVIDIIINVIIISIIIIISPYLSKYLLKENRILYGLLSIGLVIPFAGISSIIRSYFFGKEMMIPHVVSNIIEDIVRFLSIVIGIPLISKYGVIITTTFLILSNGIAEISAIITLLLFMPKNSVITKRDLRVNKPYLKDSLSIGIPTTINRLIGSFTYFLEPIILTNLLLLTNYSKNYILTNYGIINAFILPTLLLPSFFSNAISQALLPEVSKNYKLKRKDRIKIDLNKAISISLVIGIIFTIIIELFPSYILSFLYRTTKGIIYIRFMGLFFIFQYITAPLYSVLDATNNSHLNLKISIITSIIRIIILVVLSLLHLGIWSLIIDICISIIISFYLTKKDVYSVLS